MKILLLGALIFVFLIVAYFVTNKEKPESSASEDVPVTPFPIEEESVQEAAPVPAQEEVVKKKAAPKKSATKKTNNNTL